MLKHMFVSILVILAIALFSNLGHLAVFSHAKILFINLGSELPTVQLEAPQKQRETYKRFDLHLNELGESEIFGWRA